MEIARSPSKLGMRLGTFGATETQLSPLKVVSSTAIFSDEIGGTF
jgi:hypothetical protein